jgi:hypothetical protein
LHLFILLLKTHLTYKFIIISIKINKLLCFFLFRPSLCGFNKLIIKIAIHAKYNNYFFLVFSRKIKSFNVFFFQIKNTNMILLEKPSHKQFKIMLYFLKEGFLLFLFLFLKKYQFI